MTTDLTFSSSLFISATYLIDMVTSTPGGMLPTLARKMSGLAGKREREREKEKKEKEKEKEKEKKGINQNLSNPKEKGK